MPPLVPFASPAELQVLLPQCGDDLARLAVELASGRIRERVRWNVDQHTATWERLYRRIYDHGPALASSGPKREATLVLPVFNLTDIASVVVDGTTLTASQWDATRSGIIYLHGVQPREKATVAYTAGWVRRPEDTCPTVFKEVCLGLASGLGSNPERLRSYTMGGDSESFDVDLDLDSDTRLDPYTVEGL